MELLRDNAVDADQRLEVLHDLEDSLLGTLHAVLGTAELNRGALAARTGETDAHSAVVAGNLVQHLTTFGDEVLVPLGGHLNLIIHN